LLLREERVLHIRIPQTQTTIDWPAADAGRIRINGTLHLSDQKSEHIRVELSFKRAPFRRLFQRSDYWCYLRSLAHGEVEGRSPLTKEEQAQLDRFKSHLCDERIDQLPPDMLLREWGDDICSTFWLDAYADTLQGVAVRGHHAVKRLARKQLQILPGHFAGVDYRLGIDRADLRVVHALVKSEAGAKRLLCEVRWYLLPTCLIDYALRGLPRGKKHAQIQHDLMHVARCAVFVSEALVAQARQDQTLWNRLHRVLQQEECGWGLPAVDQILTLADRALRPALKQYRIRPLIGRRLSAVLDPAARQSLEEHFTHLPEQRTVWIEALLGPEGEAARRLNLTK
jgi:hypothetical protein